MGGHQYKYMGTDSMTLEDYIVQLTLQLQPTTRQKAFFASSCQAWTSSYSFLVWMAQQLLPAAVALLLSSPAHGTAISS